MAPYQATFTPTVSGSCTVAATLTDREGRTANTTATIQVDDQLPDESVVEILSPGAETITKPTEVVGTVESDILKNWRLEYRRPSDKCAEWIAFATGNAEVTEDTLGTFDTTKLRNGIYEIRIAATDRANRRPEAAAASKELEPAFERPISRMLPFALRTHFHSKAASLIFWLTIPRFRLSCRNSQIMSSK